MKPQAAAHSTPFLGDNKDQNWDILAKANNAALEMVILDWVRTSMSL